MKMNQILNNRKTFLALFLVSIFALSTMVMPLTSILPATTLVQPNATDNLNLNSQITLEKALKNLKTTLRSAETNSSTNRTAYQKIWEPNIAQAAIHAVAVSGDKLILATAGGYLKDNEIHIYTYDYTYKTVSHVTDLGDGIIQSDVQSLAIDDLDGNGYYEIVAGSSDGHIYVFEQTTTYFVLSSTPFVLTWISPEDFVRVWSLTTDDLDGDGKKEIIAGCWDNEIRVFEYLTRGGFPWTTGHWQNYTEVWSSGNATKDKLYTIATGDTDNDGFREIITGDRSGTIYIFENGRKEIDQPYPYHYDNEYVLIWNFTIPFSGALENLKVKNLDYDTNDEIAVSSYGRGVYFIDYSDSLGYTYSKIFKPLESWESNGFWPLDPYVDRLMTNYSTNVNDTAVFPYNTSMASSPDGNTAYFNVTSTRTATAVVDFGKDQEITFDGNSSTPDLYIWVVAFAIDEYPLPVNSSNFELYASNNLTTFTSLDNAEITPVLTGNLTYNIGSLTLHYLTYQVEVTLDSALPNAGLPSLRYLKLVIKGDQGLYVDAFRGILDLSLTEVTSMTIGNIDFSMFPPDSFKDKLILGTSDGRLLVYQYKYFSDSEINMTGYRMQRSWDSFEEDRFSVEDAIWSLELLNDSSLLPTWRYASLFTSTEYAFDYADITGDGTFDLIYAEYEPEGVDTSMYGSVKYRENTGSNMYPAFGSEQLLPGMTSAYGPFYHREVRPTMVDIDNDGDLDLVTGTTGYFEMNPEIYLIRNDGGTYNYVTDAFSSVNNIISSYNGTPYVSFYDMDKDGDLDMTIGMKQLFYFENRGNSTDPSWSYNSEFYKSLNEQRGQFEEFRTVSYSDFDRDGDFDLTVSLEYNFVSSVVNFSYTNLAYFENTGDLHTPIWLRNKNLYETDFQFYDNALLKDLDGDGNFELLTRYTNSTSAYYNYIYVYTPRLEHNLIFAATYPSTMIIEVDKSLISRGFEANILWSTELSMSEWTFSAEIADTDNDGKKEVIIGSFDNNIYTFENLFNGTYRRAWRSPDLKNLEAIGYPYPLWWYYDWDNVKDLTVADLDEDGLTEIIVVAGEIVYVFENVGDDNYSLVWSYEFVGTGIAVTTNPDLDGDSKSELIVATYDPASVYIFEAEGDNTYTRVWDISFTATTSGSYTVYAMPTSLIASDLDSDGKGDFIVGGYNESRYSNGDVYRIDSGFLAIFETIGDDNYSLVWTAPASHVSQNSVNYIYLGDINNNTILDFAVGTNLGVNIYEHTGTDNQYDIINVITSSATYPTMYSSQIAVYQNTAITELKIVQLLNGSFVAAYVYDSRVYTAFSENGTSWVLNGRVTTDTDQTYENSISLAASPYNNLTALVFKSDRSGSKLWYTSSSDGGQTWSTLDGLPVYTESFLSPSIALGALPFVTYIIPNTGIYITAWFFGWATPNLLDIPVNSTNLEAVSQELRILSDGSAGLVISGWNKSSVKTDYDVWYFNSRDYSNWSRAIRITSSYDNETMPSLAELEDGVLMVAYARGNAIRAKVSTNFGNKWSAEQDIQKWFYYAPFSLISLNTGGYMLGYISFWYTIIGWTFVPTYSANCVYNNITNWWYYNVRNVKAVAYGDTDNDGENEIIVGAGNVLSIFGYNQTLGMYNLSWSSEKLGAEITDIAVGDTNENGLLEIIVTAKGGYVYSFELADKDPPKVTFSNPTEYSEVSVGALSVMVSVEDKSKIATVELKLDNNEWVEASYNGGNLYIVTFNLKSPGIHVISARARDWNGLQSSVTSIEITVVEKETQRTLNTNSLQGNETDLFITVAFYGTSLLLLSIAILVTLVKKRRKYVLTQ